MFCSPLVTNDSVHFLSVAVFGSRRCLCRDTTHLSLCQAIQHWLTGWLFKVFNLLYGIKPPLWY